MIAIAHGLGHSVKHTMNKIDNAIDSFVESIDEDEDLLDTMFHVVNRATHGLLQMGRSLFRTLHRAVMRRIHTLRQ
jgi:hypothetical protein